MPLPYLTHDLPGIGGVIRHRPEDFLVEELPQYEPGGEGEHTYLLIEKIGLTTPDAIRRVAKAFGVKRTEIGCAGLKDKHAVTRQMFSIRLPDPSVQEGALRDLSHHPRLKVLWVDRHTNKLRVGHLKGNRFMIRIRDVSPTAAVGAKRVLDRLITSGVPNFVGEQRFGYRGNSHVLGRLLLLEDFDGFVHELLGRPGDDESPTLRAGREAFDAGDLTRALEHWPRGLHHERTVLDLLRQGRSPRQAVMGLDRQQRDLLVNAWQSAVFNAVLTQRIDNGTFDRLQPGDLAWKHDNGAVFAVDTEVARTENAADGRVPAMQVSPSGPLWGAKMKQALGVIADIEQQALHDSGLTLDHLVASPVGPPGARRPLRIPLANPDLSGGVDDQGPYVRLAFDLPPGAYATVVLREIIKSPNDGAASSFTNAASEP